MISDPNGGGLTADVADHLATVLGSAWSVVASIGAGDAVTGIKVVGPSTHGAVRLEPSGVAARATGRGAAEWWRGGYDPNGAPSAWCDDDPASSDGAEELADMIRSGRDGRH